MSADGLTMPPFRTVAASLRRTTERLAREVVCPSNEPPDWSDHDWAIARASAAMQGVSVLLANRLLWSGPPKWQSFLAEQLEQGQLRHSAIGSLLLRIDGAFRGAGLSAVALKGSALRQLDLYQSGERPMGDIDLLVSPDDVASIEPVLRETGYVLAYSMQRHIVFAPLNELEPKSFGEHIDNPLKIEVHSRIAEHLPVSQVGITSTLQPEHSRPGLIAYPGIDALMLHLLLHAAGSMRAHTLRQIQIHDIAALAARLTEADWSSLLAASRSGERRWWMFPPLALTGRYYPDSIPPDVLRETRSACPRMLRLVAERSALTDVSWSNLRIYAFPGAAWARTPMEAVRFARSRLLPSRLALAEIGHSLELQPQLKQIPWYNISHGNRILRWIFCRPPRVQTITSVRAALAEGVFSARS